MILSVVAYPEAELEAATRVTMGDRLGAGTLPGAAIATLAAATLISW